MCLRLTRSLFSFLMLVLIATPGTSRGRVPGVEVDKVDRVVGGTLALEHSSRASDLNHKRRLWINRLLSRTVNDNVYDHHAVSSLLGLNLSPQEGIPIYRRLLKKWWSAVVSKRSIHEGYDVAALLSVAKLGTFGMRSREVVPDLVPLLQRDQCWNAMRGEVLSTLAKIGPGDPRLIPGLIECLNDNDTDIRREAIRVLGSQQSESPFVKSALMKLLDGEMGQEDSGLAFLALGGLVRSKYKFGIVQAVERISCLNSVSVEESAAAFATLSEIRNTKTESAIVANALVSILVTEQKNYIHYSAIHAVKKHALGADPEILRALLRLSRSNDGNEAEEGDSTNDFVVRAASDLIFQSVSARTKQALPVLNESLRSTNTSERHNAALALCGMGHTASTALPHLLKSLQEEMECGNYTGVSSYADALIAMGKDAAAATPVIYAMMQPHSPYLHGEFDESSFRPYGLDILANVGLPQSTSQRQNVLRHVQLGLSSTNLALLSSAARVAGNMKTESASVIPLLTAILVSGVSNHGIFAATDETDHAHHSGSWNWADPDTQDAFAEVIHALGKLSSVTQKPVSILMEYSQMPSSAPLYGLKPAVDEALRKFGVQPGQVGTSQKLADVAGNGGMRQTLALNGRMPRLYLTALGRERIDTSSTNHKILLFVFVDAQCPCVAAYTQRIRALNNTFQSRGLRIIYVFTNPLDTGDAIRKFVNMQGISWLSVIDANQNLVKLFDARSTTQACLVDSRGVLRYSGRIDDSTYSPKFVKSKDLENAIRSILANRGVATRQIAATGCAINRS